MQLRFAHRSLQTQQHAIVEKRRMVEAIARDWHDRHAAPALRRSNPFRSLQWGD
jgi:hypothetical protein